MDIDTQLQLGQSTSLIEGFQAHVSSAPFRASAKPALYESRIRLKDPNLDAKWDWPTITLHENSESLLSALVQVKLRPTSFEDKASEGEGVPRWPSGALILAGLNANERVQALRKLSHQVGVDLSNNDLSYALVRCTRKVGTATYTSYERGLFRSSPGIVRPEAKVALKALEKSEDPTLVSMEGAKGYMDFNETFGSHFISSIEAGDSLYQVFAYAQTEFKVISELYADQREHLTGPSSTSFVIYTKPKNEAGSGYTAAAGTIGIESGDLALPQSLADGLWMDTEFSQTNSIFIAYVGATGSININTVLTKAAVISTELASLEVFAEYYRILVWRRIFRGTMYAKYGNGFDVAPYFSNNCPYDLQEVYKDSNPISGDGLMSTLATPMVNLFQERLDLTRVNLQSPEKVKIFTVFSNATEVPNPQESPEIHVTGSSCVTLFGHVFSTGRTSSPVPPNLLLSKSAYLTIKERFTCGEFYGGLRISCGTGSQFFVIINGLIFEYTQGKVSIQGDVRNLPSQKVIVERAMDLQFGLVAAEARLNFLLAGTSKNDSNLALMKRFLFWLAALAGGESGTATNGQLAALQARALYLATVAASSAKVGVPLSCLSYEAYKDVVNNVHNVINTASSQLTSFQEQIRDRKTEERLLDDQGASNENIISSGKLLHDYIAAQASCQRSLSDKFKPVFEKKKTELDMATKRAEKLSVSLEQQRKVVEVEVDNYKKAFEAWMNRQMIQTALNLATEIFKVGFVFVAPAGASNSLSKLGTTVNVIQTAVKAFDAVIRAYHKLNAMPTNPKDLIDTLQDVGMMGVTVPPAEEWDLMKVNMNAILKTGLDIPNRKTLTAAFSVLVSRGKALLDCQNTIQQIAADLSSESLKSRLTGEHQKRFEELKVNLDAKPEDLKVDRVDLIGLSGQLLLFQRQMLIILASTVVIQDRALQYEHIRPPTAIGSLTMLNLQLAIQNQSTSINEGITVQPPPTDQEFPIIYEIHGVNPKSITNNQAYSFEIHLNKREFASYNYVRVKEIAVEIGGIASTNSGKYYTELVFDGNPFYDRGFNGEPLTFQTASRIYTGLHEVSSSSRKPPMHHVNPPKSLMRLAVFDNCSLDNVSQITPFSKWKVSLPTTTTNEGIKFDDCAGGVIVRLTFRIFAQLTETSQTPKEIFMRSRQLLISRGFRTGRANINPDEYEVDFPQVKPKSLPGGRYLNQVSKKDKPKRIGLHTKNVSNNDVLCAMKGKSVCAGWDVVFSMTVEQVNEQLRLQYEDHLGNPTFVRETGDVSEESETSEGVIFKTDFNFKFSAPKLEFIVNNSSYAQVILPMISGKYKLYIFYDGAWVVVDKHEVQESDMSYVQGDVPLSVLAGTVSSQDNVCVELNGGSFSAENFKPATANNNMNLVLTNYFTHLEDGYELYKFGAIDYTGISTIEALKPKEFRINVYQTPSDRDLLQLFIATTGKVQSSAFLYLQEPIPTNYQSSMIINTQILFKDVLPATLADAGIGLVLKAVSPANDSNKDKVWSAIATSGTIRGPFPATMVFENELPTMYVVFHYEYYLAMPDDTVTVDIAGMKFQCGDPETAWTVKSQFESKGADYTFKYGSREYRCTVAGCTDWTPIGYKSYPAKANIGLKSVLPFAVQGEGRDQVLKIAATTSNVAVEGFVEPPSDTCECEDTDLQETFVENLQKFLPPVMRDIFNQTFSSISLFALNNILFPAKNVIDMKETFVPGDMVIFGNFT